MAGAEEMVGADDRESLGVLVSVTDAAERLPTSGQSIDALIRSE
jgi:hypothetical protein